MIAIKDNIIEAYDKTRHSHLLYGDTKWHKKPQTIYFGVFIFFSLIMLSLNLKYQIYFIAIWAVLFVLGFFTVVNPLYKRKAKSKLETKINKEFMAHWASLEFKGEQLKIFYNDLVSKKVLTNTEKDIEMLDEYKIFFEVVSDQLKTNEKLIYGGGAILLFALPVWSSSTTLMLNETKDIIETYKLILKFLFLIYCFIYFIGLFKFGVDEILNSTSRKYIDISQQLNELRLNKKLKYPIINS